MIFVLYHFLIFYHKYALSFWWMLRLNMDTESQNDKAYVRVIPKAQTSDTPKCFDTARVSFYFYLYLLSESRSC